MATIISCTTEVNQDEKPNFQNEKTETLINKEDISEALEKQLINNNANYGAVLLIDIKTGNEILSIEFVKADSNCYQTCDTIINKVITPASLWKPITMALLLESNCVTLNDSIDTKQGSISYNGIEMRDVFDLGTININQAMAKSSNIFFAEAVNKCYSSDMSKYYNDFNSLIKVVNKEFVDRLDFSIDSLHTMLWSSIGYYHSIKPKELLSLYSIIANNGLDVNNKRILKSETAQAVHEALSEVVQNGTGQELKPLDCAVAGKTGLTDMSNGNFINTFAGYFPADNPKYVCFFMMQIPANNLVYGNKWTFEMMEILTKQ